MMSVIFFDFEPGVLPERELNRVRELTPAMRLLITRERNEIEATLDEIEIAVGGFPHDLLPRARALRWLHQWGAGADWLLRHPQAAEMDFVLTNTSGIHAIPIGEHIMAFLLAFARGFHRAARDQAQRRWRDQGEQRGLFELPDKIMLLIGVGAIGERTAALATAFGMRVWGVRRNPTLAAPGVERMAGPDRLLELLPAADFVVLTAPLTRETQGLIGERELRAMKPSACIVNIGRGGLIQESALIHALREGWIAGAGLDVFETEPLPEDSPLWGMENVIITTHYAGVTPHYDERALAIFLENLPRYLAGAPMRNVVDKRLGY